MTTKSKSWTAEYFSQSNPAGPQQGDVPSLLRRVAKSLDKIGPVDVQDLVLHTEATADGPWPSLTVYFHHPATETEKKRRRRKVARRRKPS